MKLYYGADKLIKNPVRGLGNPSNDYGLGFYLTPEKEAARLWASRYEQGKIITYDVNLSSLKVLYLADSGEEDILRWITILVKHRFDKMEKARYKDTIDWLISKFDINIEDYDMVVGYRADDSYFAYSLGFVSGEISIETLASAMKLGKLGLQYVLISDKAFSSIKFVSAEDTLQNDDYDVFRQKTLDEYHLLLNQEDVFNNTFIREIMKKYGR